MDVEEKLLPSTTVLISIGMFIGSFIVGIAFYYAIIPSNRQKKKQRVDELLSFIINFVLFIWAGKIIVHLTLFFQDPFAVLAYPSDARAFYIATILLVINLLYHIIRKGFQIKTFIATAIPVFLATGFTYELLQIIVVDSRLAWPNILLMACLLIIFVFMHDRQSINRIALTVFTIWTLGHLMFYFSFSFTKVFGYFIHPIYFLSIYVLGIGLFLYSKRRQVVDHGN